VWQHLSKYVDETFSSREFAELISNQVSVGSMVKAEGEDQPLAFITAMNLLQYEDQKCVKQLTAWLLSQCKDSAKKKTLQGLLESPTCGLLIQEGVVNLPLELVPNLHQSIQDDIAWAIENEEEDVRVFFKFDTMLMVMRYAGEAPGSVGTTSTSASSSSCSKSSKSNAETESPKKNKAASGFTKFADRFYYEETFFKYSFRQSDTSLSSSSSEPKSSIPQHVVVIAFKYDRFPDIQKKIAEAVESSISSSKSTS